VSSGVANPPCVEPELPSMTAILPRTMKRETPGMGLWLDSWVDRGIGSMRSSRLSD
jgi:hypothetical protein